MKWQSIKFAFLAAASLSLSTLTSHAVAGQYNDWGCQPAPQSCCCPCGSLALRADVLSWKAIGSNTTFISDFDDQRFLTEYNLQDADVFRAGVKTKSLDFDRDVGFRVGARYDFACNCWSAGFLWTHFNTKASGKFDPACCPFKLDSTNDSYYDVKTSYNLDLDYWDLECSKILVCGECVNVNLFLGIRGLRLDQKYKSCSEYFVEFVDLAESKARQASILPFVERELGIHERHKFRGAGPRIGLDFDADLFCGLGVYGEAAVAGIVGYSKHNVNDCLSDLQGGIAFDAFHGIYSDKRCEKLQSNRAMTDLALGISLNPGSFCCLRQIQLNFGWEHHTIFGQKYAYFGGDQLPVSREIFPTFKYVPSPLKKLCDSTLAVHGFVFSAMVGF